jgi:hypothetical protein
MLVGIVVASALLAASAQATGGVRIAAACSNETVNGGTYAGKLTPRFVLHGKVSCNKAPSLIRAYFRHVAPPSGYCRNRGTACSFIFAGGGDCAFHVVGEHDGAAGCVRESPFATVMVYRVTRLTKAAKAPVLGDGAAGPIGYGHAHPVRIGQATTLTTQVTGLRWKHWGARQATATGTGFWLPPTARSFSQAQPARADMVAFDLGTCKGTRAYLKMEWFFPGHGGRFRSSHANTICV